MKKVRVVTLTEDVKMNGVELLKGMNFITEGQIQKVNSGELFHIIRDHENRVMFLHENKCRLAEMGEEEWRSHDISVS